MTQYFGKPSGTSASDIFYRMKRVPLLNLKRSGSGDGSLDIPTMRSGISNFFRLVSPTSLTLRNSLTNTIVATVASTSILASSQFCSYYLDSTDQCLYVLVEDNTQLKLAKISDTTGVVTDIGSAFTPANFANWPKSSSVMGFGFMDKVATNELRVIQNGFIHKVDKAVGGIITEDTPIVVGDYITAGANYINSTSDIVAASSFGVPDSSSSTLSSITLPEVFTVKTGIRKSTVLISDFLPVANSRTASCLAIDDKWLCYVDQDDPTPLKVILRSDFERLLESVVNYEAGLI